MLGEEQHVLAPVAERRDRHCQDGEAVVEILAEIAGCNHCGEVAVSGADHAGIDGYRAAAHRANLLLL